jgi:methylamine dehydrogenase accessory protein MauD
MSGWWLASYLALWILLFATLVVLLVVLRQLGLIYLRSHGGGGMSVDEGPPVGTLFRFDELDINGQTIHFPDHQLALNLLLFTTPWCAICKDALRGLSTVLGDYEVNAVVVDAGEGAESAAVYELVEDEVGFVASLPLQRRIGVTTIPYAMVTDERGVILSKGGVNHVDDLEDLLARAEEAREEVHHGNGQHEDAHHSVSA